MPIILYTPSFSNSSDISRQKAKKRDQCPMTLLFHRKPLLENQVSKIYSALVLHQTANSVIITSSGDIIDKEISVFALKFCAYFCVPVVGGDKNIAYL